MGRLKWYKRDPDAALSGMFELTLEERGAYNTVLDLIYSRAGDLPDDDRWIAGWMRCDVRVWRRIKARLIEAGKLYVSCMKLRNKRADATILEGLSMVGSRTEAGRTGGVKSGEVRRKNKDLSEANIEANANTTTTKSTSREDVVVGARARGLDALREAFPDLDADLALASLSGSAGMIDAWIGDGADLDRDILPTIRRLAAERRRKQRGPPRTFGYFAQAVADARQANTEPLPDARPPHARNGQPAKPAFRNGWAELVHTRFLADGIDGDGHDPPDVEAPGGGDADHPPGGRRLAARPRGAH